VQRFFGNGFWGFMPIYGSKDLTVHARYQVGLGGDAFVAMSVLAVEIGGVGGQGEAQLRQALVDGLPVRVVARLKQAVSIPLIATEDAPDDAYCQGAVNGTPRGQGALIGMLSVRLGDATAARAIVAGLHPSRFVALDDADGVRRCKYVPRLLRVNVMPDALELVLANYLHETAERRLYAALAPDLCRARAGSMPRSRRTPSSAADRPATPPSTPARPGSSTVRCQSTSRPCRSANREAVDDDATASSAAITLPRLRPRSEAAA